jgi:hypothetical protein
MIVLCVLYSKGQKTKPGHSGLRSTDKSTEKIIPSGVAGEFSVAGGGGVKTASA